MSFGVQIPKSNTLRMVRTDNQGSNLQNFDNRLLNQMDFEDYNDVFYAQKIAGTDTILIQFATDYLLGTITAKIYDLEDNEVSDKTASITSKLVSTSFTIYDLSFTFATEGYYYLVIDFDGSTEVYTSEVFQIDGFTTEHMLKIEYNISDNDGIVYNDNQTFIIRIEGRLAEYKPGQQKETYKNYNESLVNLNSFPIREFSLEYGFVPMYMVEKLNLALAHEVFKINDVEYQSEGAPDSELLSDGNDITNMYKGKVKLQQVTYEDYTTATDDVEPETNYILIDEFDNRLILRDQSVDNFVRYKD
jgi:hypothetical protein